MEIYTPEDLKEKFNDPWIAPYKKVLTMVEGDLVEIVEYHPCVSGSHWVVNQYQRTSELIQSSFRDGNKHVFLVKVGKTPLELKASVNAAGIEEVRVQNDEVKVIHAGLAGAGVGAAFCRGMANGVKRVELFDMGGGSKLGKAAVVTPRMEKVVIGVDDTDTREEGATWTMAHNMGMELAKQGFQYLDHIIVQLYPHNPHKTQNCVSVALSFAIKPGEAEILVEKAKKILKKNTLSDNTAIAVLNGINIPPMLRDYAEKAKKTMITVEEAEHVAEKLNLPLFEITGSQGKIGALAALGLYNDVEEAVNVYY